MDSYYDSETTYETDFDPCASGDLVDIDIDADATGTWTGSVDVAGNDYVDEVSYDEWSGDGCFDEFDLPPAPEPTATVWTPVAPAPEPTPTVWTPVAPAPEPTPTVWTPVTPAPAATTQWVPYTGDPAAVADLLAQRTLSPNELAYATNGTMENAWTYRINDTILKNTPSPVF